MNALTPFEVAQAQLLRAASDQHQTQPIAQETLPLAQANGRILAQDILAQLDTPRTDISAMDGYALCFSESFATAGSHFNVVGESLAGKPYTGELMPGECVLIATGASSPSQAQTVQMQENTTYHSAQDSENSSAYIVLNQDTPRDINIRFKAEEIQAGSVLLPKGHRLEAQDIMLLAAQGYAELPVYRPLKVSVFTGGDELTSVGNPLASEHAIYDCNGPALLALLDSLPVDIVDHQILPDQPDAILTALKQASERSDVLITSGGVSVGKHDFLRDCLAQLGQISLYKIAMKPGKPFSSGRIGQCLYFGLPGNPLSTFIGFDQLVRPALLALAGQTAPAETLRFSAKLTHAVKKRPGRMDFQRGILQSTTSSTGLIEWQVTPLDQQDSHRILGFSQADALIVLAAETGPLEAGTTVTVQPVRGR